MPQQQRCVDTFVEYSGGDIVFSHYVQTRPMFLDPEIVQMDNVMFGQGEDQQAAIIFRSSSVLNRSWSSGHHRWSSVRNSPPICSNRSTLHPIPSVSTDPFSSFCSLLKPNTALSKRYVHFQKDSWILLGDNLFLGVQGVHNLAGKSDVAIG